MSSQTANYQLSLREANDIFNPLSTNDNFTKIDELLFKQTMPLYTSVVSGNLLTLSGTPSKQDTVFKFIATGSANSWSFGGSIYNIITPDGNQFSTVSGKMYVGYVDENNMLVLLAWPSAVNAQTFDNQPSSYYATDSELQAVNTTAANAVQTAQAAQTVANSALEKAEAAGFSMELVWTNPAPSNQMGYTEIPITLKKTPKLFLIRWAENTSSGSDCHQSISLVSPSDNINLYPCALTSMDSSATGSPIKKTRDVYTSPTLIKIAIGYASYWTSSPYRDTYNYCNLVREVYALY